MKLNLTKDWYERRIENEEDATSMNKIDLSEKVRANSEAAPWVIDEIKSLEKELERLRAEVEMGHSFHRVAVKERDFERLLVEALKEELAAAKAEQDDIRRENEWRNG